MSGRQYFEHDDRGPSTSKPNYQRLIFAMGRHKDKKYRNSAFSGGKSRMIDFDADVDMVSSNHSNFDHRRFNPYSQNNKICICGRRKCKKNCKTKRDHGSHGNDRANTHTWYRVTVPHGRKHGKEFIIKSINSLIKVPFTPYNFQFNKSNAEFFVNGHSTAICLRELNRRVTTPNGLKMVLILCNVRDPIPVIDPDALEVIKASMSACYDPERHSLNLMKFHEMDSLKMHGLYIPLCKNTVFQPVLKIIRDNIPELEILILSYNKLYNLEAAACLVPVCKQLKFINLHNNKLRSMNELNFLKGLDLEELILDGNPLCDDFKDKASYIR